MKLFSFVRFLGLFWISGWIASGCGTLSQAERNENAEVAPPSRDAFGEYWYAGKAEITSYTLQQERYGAVHEGEAVLIFVTEDFSKSKQVKLDYPPEIPEDAVKVLKLNAMRRFNTGIYAYSLMQSVFTPIRSEEFPHTLKITSTLQDWCGHSFFQMNLQKKKYVCHQYSYFENEADATFKISAAMVEDELWTRLRLNPETLPTGTFTLIPSALDATLRHYTHKPQTAKATLEANPNNAAQMVYTVAYQTLPRTLTFYFQKEFPFALEKWEETHGNGNTTIATQKERMQTAYWQQNRPKHLPLRDSLRLQF